MRSKRLFAILLAFCLVFSALAPAASAVAVTETSMNAQLETAKKNEVTKNNENGNENNWVIEPVEDMPAVSLLPTTTNECLEELKVAAELYDQDEMVCAFVVMEDKPLAESYTSRLKVNAQLEKQMIQKQDAVIASIEKSILEGQKLEVRYQFTYLTNSFTIKTAFGNLKDIAKLEGVKSVFVTPVFEPATTATPDTAAAGPMTGVHTVWKELGYTGTGMKIAIIDTGLDLDHPSFAAAPETNENSLTVKDIAAVLGNLNAFARKNTITADDLYRSVKVPYAFNYVDENLTADHSKDKQGDHGTHVAGIAAANALEGVNVVGMAPDAQLIIMKVFGAAGGAYMDDVAAALEDAMTLGCDVVNASLGSPRGFTTSNSELDLIYERLASQDIVATFSAGNEGTSSAENTWGTDMNRTQNPDNATIGAPSTWPNTLSIASAQNSAVMSDNLVLADGTVIFYQDSMAAIYKDAGYPQYNWAVMLKEIADEEYEYVMVPGLGSKDDYASVDVEGKIAIVKRGELNFVDKIRNGENAGAAAVLIWNNQEEDIYTFGLPSSEGDYKATIPAALITLSDGQLMENAEVKTMTVSSEQKARQCEGGQMSSFSSWGVTPDLQLMPDITGIGGNVYSCYDNGKYGVMSGTSMSAPQIAGITALVMQRLYTIYPDAPDGSIRNLAEAILMSTADPIISAVSRVEASPRQQGAGLVDAYEATSTTTYLTVAGGRPKAELGDSADGKYTFSFEIHNIGDEDKTYTLNASLLTEYAASAGGGLYFMYGENIPLSGNVSFDKNKITVPAGGRTSVTVSIALSDSDKAYFANYWKNGGYVEGYVYLCNEEGASELNLPFLGFYGDWTDAPVFDTAYWYDNSFWKVPPVNGLPEGDEYYHVIWTAMGEDDWVLGMNPYADLYLDSNGKIYYDPAHNVVSPNGDGYLDGIAEIYLSLLRNAKTLVFNYTVDGELVYQEIIEDNPKTMYLSSYGQIVPWIYSWYGRDFYDFTDANGDVLPDGTEVLLTIEGYVDYGNGGNNTIQIPFIVDNEAPELIDVYEVQQDGKDLIYIELTENVAPATAVLLNSSGTKVLAQTDYFVDSGEGTYLTAFDITGLGNDFLLILGDYGCNESGYTIHYTGSQPTEPEDKVEWTAATTTLGGSIGLNFYVKLPEAVVNDPTTYVQFTYAGKVVNVPMADALLSGTEEDPEYRFSCQLYAKNMTDVVTAQVMNENGTVGDAVQYSIQAYCKYMLGSDDAKTVALCKAMLNYGTAAQLNFNYNTDKLANAVLDEADRIPADVEVPDAYAAKVTGSADGITADGATLLLESDVAIRVYFMLDEGADISDYTFAINGEEVAVRKNSGGYYVQTAPIPAKNLDDMFEFTVDGLTISYGGLSYVKTMLESEKEEDVYMVKALFAYNAAADAYFAK